MIPEDWTLEQLLWKHPSRPRNKIIAQAFFDMGIIERYGSGIKRIKKECDKNGNPYPEWSDLHGEFATTYRPRAARDKSSIGLGGNGGKSCKQVQGAICRRCGKDILPNRDIRRAGRKPNKKDSASF